MKKIEPPYIVYNPKTKKRYIVLGSEKIEVFTEKQENQICALIIDRMFLEQRIDKKIKKIDKELADEIANENCELYAELLGERKSLEWVKKHLKGKK